MFAYFHDHKNKYSKGQLAPVYILVLVIVIIMAMVTVNLSKVAMIKTDTANAADAGALATGAIMANVFNSVAVQNSLMMTAYWSTYMTVSLMFVIAFYKLTSAYISASTAFADGTTGVGMAQCPTSCAAASIVGSAAFAASAAPALLIAAKKAIYGIWLVVAAAWWTQHMNYLLIRRMAIKGRSSSIKNGHGFVFSNSGIGSKLKAGSPLSGVTDTLEKNGYRDIYVDFMDGISDNGYYNYSWKDGQDRLHSVDSNVLVPEVDDFELKAAALMFPLEIAALSAAAVLVITANTSMLLATTGYAGAAATLATACAFFMCCNPSPPGLACCAKCEMWAEIGRGELAKPLGENSAALIAMTATFVLLISALAGLFPALSISSSSETDDLPYIDCWISDINVSDYKVRVDTKQTHQGADLGLWKTTYPDTASYAVADFSGRGSIDPPNPRYGSDIVDVDKY